MDTDKIIGSRNLSQLSMPPAANHPNGKPQHCKCSSGFCLEFFRETDSPTPPNLCRRSEQENSGDRPSPKSAIYPGVCGFLGWVVQTDPKPPKSQCSHPFGFPSPQWHWLFHSNAIA